MVHITELDKLIANNILLLRTKYKISSNVLSKHLNLTSAFVRNCEAGLKKYNIKHLVLIHELFCEKDNKFTFDEFFVGITDEMLYDLKEIKRINGVYQREI